MRAWMLAASLLLCGSAFAQDRELIEGQVYSYVMDGMRHYETSVPKGATDVRVINYSFHEVLQSREVTPERTGIAGFRGYSCRSDCSGHRAGYDWARRRGVSRQSACSGNSQSFIEGCWAWVNEMESTR